MLVSSISYTNILGAAVVGTAVVVGATVGTAVGSTVGTVVGAADAVGCGDHASEFGNAESTNQPLLQGASLPSPQLAS
jgi:hypothetical protein